MELWEEGASYCSRRDLELEFVLNVVGFESVANLTVLSER